MPPHPHHQPPRLPIPLSLPAHQCRNTQWHQARTPLSYHIPATLVPCHPCQTYYHLFTHSSNDLPTRLPTYLLTNIPVYLPTFQLLVLPACFPTYLLTIPSYPHVHLAIHRPTRFITHVKTCPFPYSQPSHEVLCHPSSETFIVTPHTY